MSDITHLFFLVEHKALEAGSVSFVGTKYKTSLTGSTDGLSTLYVIYNAI